MSALIYLVPYNNWKLVEISENNCSAHLTKWLVTAGNGPLFQKTNEKELR